MPMKLLVTGAAGYIGSHTCLELLQAGYDIIAIDNLCNSRLESIKRVQELAGKPLEFHCIDIQDKETLGSVFKKSNIDAVIHFAALKAVGESVEQPLKYYRNNLAGTIALCEAMSEHGVKRMVFSSTAAVYGTPQVLPLREDSPTTPANPYGYTKLMMEQVLGDLHHADAEWQVAILRYFNVVGAHPSGMIGENPKGVPTSLFPNVLQSATGNLPEFRIYGNDYPTPDGTAIRDYIHVVDLAIGHVKALKKLMLNPGRVVYNLGTGQGFSVMDIIKGFEEVSGRKIPYRLSARRPGDIAVCYADSSLAQKELGWSAERQIEQMCSDAWRWQSLNPNGYAQ